MIVLLRYDVTGILDIGSCTASNPDQNLRRAGYSSKRANGERLWAFVPAQLHSPRTTLRRWCKTQADRAWISAWREERRGHATYRHTLTCTKNVLQLHERLSKRESALLVQLRTEKIGLNDFLFN